MKSRVSEQCFIYRKGRTPGLKRTHAVSLIHISAKRSLSFCIVQFNLHFRPPDHITLHIQHSSQSTGRNSHAQEYQEK